MRFIAAGSVDDGKSTLIGRLLHDTRAVLEDQLEHVEAVSRQRGDARPNLSLLTDGLRAEREQGITIDVAYRYFATERRKFVIADAPGHVQYTRNMVTGASTADLAIVLVDARRGVSEQSRRHTYLASLLGIRHLVFAVNKMDLVGGSEAAFAAIAAELGGLVAKLGPHDVRIIPVSALQGDNVVHPSESMPWYDGPTLLSHLETVRLASERDLGALRFPVQWVIRPRSDEHHDYRGYAGVMAGGRLGAGDLVVVLPSGVTTRVTRIETYDGPLEEARARMAVTVHLRDAVDVSRGDMLCHPAEVPHVGTELQAVVAWMSSRPLKEGSRYSLKHTTRWVKATVTAIDWELDVNRLERARGSGALGPNGIGGVRLRTTAPLFYDPYARNRATGSFILVDDATNETVGAGMLGAPDAPAEAG